jgi:replicative DNA helicase
MSDIDQDPGYAQEAAVRAMPQNLDAERAVLAAMILSPDILQEILAQIKSPTVFYRPAHQKIYNAILGLFEDGIPVDQLSLAERLKTEGKLDEIGGRPYIIEIGNHSFALANWQAHVDIISRAALRRDLIAASTQITALGYNPNTDDTDELVGEAERAILSITDRQTSNNFMGLEDMAKETMDIMYTMADSQQHLLGVPTGFADLDAKLSGLRGGQLMILAARPAVGKSAFAINLGMNAAARGTRVAFFSLEMSTAEIMPRILSAESNLPLQKMRSANLEENDWSALYSTIGRIQKYDFSVDDTPSLSIMQLRTKARRQLRNCDGNGLVIVDYLQLMEPQTKRTESRQVEVAEISRGLKILAKELNVPVIALSQLSRAVESRTNRRPQLSDLRESGSIEQDADIVAFIDRSTTAEEAESPNRPGPGEAQLILAKNRNGETGTVPLVFIGHCTRFASAAFPATTAE